MRTENEPATDLARAQAFIRANTGMASPPHVPEVRLHLADEAHDLWQRTEEELATLGVPPPFWAFAWAGGQAVARFVLDNRDLVAGRSVLDFATGSGLVGIAAAMAGAARVTACDIDPYSRAAVLLNSRENGVSLEFAAMDLIGEDAAWDVVLAGDVFYEKPLADRLLPWFEALSQRGATVILGDPGRSYLPHPRLQRLETYEVAVTRALEDAEVKRTAVWRFI